MYSWRWHYDTPEFSEDEPITNQDVIKTDTETDEEPTTTITMAGESATMTTSKEVKKKLKTPMPYTGKREDLQKFLQKIKIYLLANGEAYPTNLDKILFMFSYMNDGDANSWKEEYVKTAEQVAVQSNSDISFGIIQHSSKS